MELQSFVYRTCTGLSMRGFFEARLSLVHNISICFVVVLFVFSAFVVPQFNKMIINKNNINIIRLFCDALEHNLIYE